MIHLGDITKINGSTVEPVNVIIGGSPCQDLSIAGGRAGCKGGGKGALIQIEKSGTLCPNNDQTLFTMQGFGDYKRGG